MYQVIGRDSGKQVVRFEDGRTELLTDEQLADLQGGKAVLDLKERKKAESLEKVVADLEKDLAAKDSEVARLTSVADASAKAAQEWQERCETAEVELVNAKATVEELTAANKALEQAAAMGPMVPVETSETPEVPTSAKTDGGGAGAMSLEYAMTVRVDGYGWDKLKAVCEALGIEPAESKPETIAAIKAERERRAGGGE